MNLGEATRRAWQVIEGCGRGGTLIAASGSALYPHVWTRDVGVAALGIAAARRTAADLAPLAASLRLLARHQDPRGRLPLKVDAAADRPVSENSAGVDAGPWFAIAVYALARASEAVDRDLVAAAARALEWTAGLDVDGSELLAAPEASDWADMMPHRHHVLNLNVLHVAALRALAHLVDRDAATLRERAARIARTIELRFAIDGATDGEAVARRLTRLAAASPEWALTGQYATRYGDLPFYLPYLGFRAVGRHFDVVGNMTAILAGVADPARAARILDHADRVGVDRPGPSKTSDPPIYPGDPDWRDHFRWRNLCLPHQYQNGGAWPFAGALHIAAALHAGRRERAEQMTARLIEVCLDPRAPFPEWLHGVTGASMGERDQLWSATGVLWIAASLPAGRPALFSELSS